MQIPFGVVFGQQTLRPTLDHPRQEQPIGLRRGSLEDGRGALERRGAGVADPAPLPTRSGSIGRADRVPHVEHGPGRSSVKGTLQRPDGGNDGLTVSDPVDHVRPTNVDAFKP